LGSAAGGSVPTEAASCRGRSTQGREGGAARLAKKLATDEPAPRRKRAARSRPAAPPRRTRSESGSRGSSGRRRRGRPRRKSRSRTRQSSSRHGWRRRSGSWPNCGRRRRPSGERVAGRTAPRRRWLWCRGVISTPIRAGHCPLLADCKIARGRSSPGRPAPAASGAEGQAARRAPVCGCGRGTRSASGRWRPGATAVPCPPPPTAPSASETCGRAPAWPCSPGTIHSSASPPPRTGLLLSSREAHEEASSSSASRTWTGPEPKAA
jgi:hypothetical protein